MNRRNFLKMFIAVSGSALIPKDVLAFTESNNTNELPDIKTGWLISYGIIYQYGESDAGKIVFPLEIPGEVISVSGLSSDGTPVSFSDISNSGAYSNEPCIWLSVGRERVSSQ